MTRLRFRPALGRSATPEFARRSGAPVPRHRPGFADARWSYLYGPDSGYGGPPPDAGEVSAANRRARSGPVPDVVQGPVLQAPVWTWEIPVYFWAGGVAAGSSFVALACDLSGDHRSAAIARKVALAATLPCPPLLILDLGRPLRFLNMLRIFKPRSPMATGVWALVGFSGFGTGAVAADLLGRARVARVLGAATAVVGGYFGSYTGVLLAATAVPVWARSRLFLGPIFVATGAATGAAACRLVLVALGLPPGHPTRQALGNVETFAMASELALSELNERRLGASGESLRRGTPGRAFRAAKAAVRTGLALRVPRMLGAPPWVHHAASVLYLAGGLLFRVAWVGAGRDSARDDRAVAEMARGRRKGG